MNPFPLPFIFSNTGGYVHLNIDEIQSQIPLEENILLLQVMCKEDIYIGMLP